MTLSLATIAHEAGTFAALIDGDDVRRLEFADVDAVLRAGISTRAELEALPSTTVEADGLVRAPVLTRPRNIVCVGLNYSGHISEMKRETPVYPTLFFKSRTTLIGASDDIQLSTASERWDYEAELAVVLRAGARNVSAEEAAGLIAGYTVLNDVSARDWQNHTLQWGPGKNFDRTCPLGPSLVLAEDVPDYRALTVECRVNGRVVQSASCDELVFSPADVISYISTFMTLQPGDVIAMGTPAGVAAATSGPWLTDGDVLTTSITSLGVVENVCRAV